MKKLVLVLGLLAIFASTAFAQGAFLTANIPFEFVVSGKTFPAGDYDFRMTGPGEHFLQMSNHHTGAVIATVVPITRIAAASHEPGTGRVSFDVTDGKHFVEAVWPATGDGYLLHAVKREHTHEVVQLNK